MIQVVNSEVVKDKKVLLRYDIDVQITDGKVTEDFKLKAGLETLRLCIENASKVVIIGHVGRPAVPSADLSAKPIAEWFEKQLGQSVEFVITLEQAKNSSAKIILLENIRFFHGEVESDVDFAKQLATLGDVYVNEAFSAHNVAASTTMVPTLLPHAAGLHFVKEVETLLNVRNNPKKPFIGIMGGAKVKDKLPVISVLARNADAVLVGGKLVHEIREEEVELPSNVLVGKLNEDGFDIAPETTSAWGDLISKAKMIVWNGPVGKFEDPKYNQTEELIKLVLNSGAEIVIGGGDSVAALSQYGLLEQAEKVGFVSVGGGAMLKLISDGTLPTIEALA